MRGSLQIFVAALMMVGMTDQEAVLQNAQGLFQDLETGPLEHLGICGEIEMLERECCFWVHEERWVVALL
jgi:hypothetical protein